MSDTLRDSLFKLFWTMANVALGAGAVEVAGWDQGVATFIVTGLIQLASTFVRGKIDAASTEARAARTDWTN